MNRKMSANERNETKRTSQPSNVCTYVRTYVCLFISAEQNIVSIVKIQRLLGAHLCLYDCICDMWEHVVSFISHLMVLTLKHRNALNKYPHNVDACWWKWMLDCFLSRLKEKIHCDPLMVDSLSLQTMEIFLFSTTLCWWDVHAHAYVFWVGCFCL